MICTCEKCHYTFAFDSLPLSCPDCGSNAVCEATLEEKDWYHDLEMEKKHNPLLLDKADYKASYVSAMEKFAG